MARRPTRRTAAMRSSCSVPPATWRARRSSRLSMRCRRQGVSASRSSGWRRRREMTTSSASGPRRRSRNTTPTSTPTTWQALSGLISYVSGDYREPDVYQALAERLKDKERPLFYLAIPPVLFDDVIDGLAAVGSTDGARVVVEKPFGRDRESARAAERDACTRRSPRSRSSASTTTSARSRSRTCSCSVSPTRCSSRSGTATSSRTSRSRWPRSSASAGRGRFYETVGALRDVVQNHLLQIVALLAMEPPAGADCRRAARREGQAVQADPHDRPERRRAGPVPHYSDEPGVDARLRRRDVRRPAVRDRLVALGRRAVADCGPARRSPTTATEAVVDVQRPAAPAVHRGGQP